MRHAVGLFVVWSIASSAAGVTAAYAQSGNNSALAEQLFNQGRDLVKAGQWADACPKFEASMKYDPVLGTKLNLATCYEHIGKLASAWGLYREAGDLAKKAGDTKRADYAQKQATALEPRMPKLTISAPPNAPVGLLVKRDDTVVESAALGTALYVDPGQHVVTASAPGFVLFSKNVTLVESKTETVAVPLLVAKTVEPTGPLKTAEQVDTSETPRPSNKYRYAGLITAGGGVALAGVGLVFGLQASKKYSDAKDLCGDELRCSAENLDKDKKLVSDAKSKATLSTVFVIGGGVAIAAGVVLYVMAPRLQEQAPATAHIVPVVHDGGGGFAWTGSF